jgi:hypothetical protein
MLEMVVRRLRIYFCDTDILGFTHCSGDILLLCVNRVILESAVHMRYPKYVKINRIA